MDKSWEWRSVSFNPAERRDISKGGETVRTEVVERYSK